MDFKTAVSAAFAYALMVSACYLYGYWGTFNINVLEQIAFTDLAKVAFYPIVISAVFLLLGSTISHLLVGNLYPPGGGAVRPDGSARTWPLWLSGLLLIAAFCAWYFLPAPTKWPVVGLLAGTAAFPLSGLPVLCKAISHGGVRTLAVIFAVAFLTQAVSKGQYEAYDVLSGKPKREIDVVRSGLPLMTGHTAPVAYLGLLGDTHFLYESATGQVVEIHENDNLRLFFKRDREPSKMVREAKRELFNRIQTMPTKPIPF